MEMLGDQNHRDKLFSSSVTLNLVNYVRAYRSRVSIFASLLSRFGRKTPQRERRAAARGT